MCILKKKILSYAFAFKILPLSYGFCSFDRAILESNIPLDKIISFQNISPEGLFEFRCYLESKIENSAVEEGRDVFLEKIQTFCSAIIYDESQFATWVIRENNTSKRGEDKYYLITNTIPEKGNNVKEMCKIYDHNKSIIQDYYSFALRNFEKMQLKRSYLRDKRKVSHQDHEKAPILIESVPKWLVDRHTKNNVICFESFWLDIETIDVNARELEKVAPPYFLRWRKQNSPPVE